MPQTITGTFSQVVHSPKGGVEGLLVEADHGPVQLVLAKDDEKAAAIVASLKPGQHVVAVAEEPPLSPKGPASHRVAMLRKFKSIAGGPVRATKAIATGYSGKVVRLNYARHGVPNGFILDTGDFVHVKPEGFAKLGLKLGDAVQADGDAHFLSTGGGWAVEATVVNRKKIK